MRFRVPRFVPAAAGAAAMLFALVGCTTGSAPSPTSPATTAAAPTSGAVPTTEAAPTTTGSTQACADLAALRSSLEALTKVRPAQDGAVALKTAIDNVRTNLEAAQASAADSEALQPTVQQVKTSFDDLQSAASGVTAGNITQKAPAIASALRQVGTATQALSAKLAEVCPGS